MTPVRVHVAGMRSGPDPAENRRAALATVARASTDGAHLVVLPEYASVFDPRGTPPGWAEPLDGPFVTALSDAARATGVVVVAGTLLPGSRPDRAVNAVVVAGPSQVAVYRKVHLYDAFGHRESDVLEAGDAGAVPVVVDVAGLRLGIMTCYDLRFPESARRLVDAGATAIAVPAAWAAGEHKAEQWRTLLRARAVENVAYVLGSVQQGPGVTGAALVVDPQGVVVGEDPAAGRAGATSPELPALVVAELDADVVAAARERNPSLENRRYVVVPRA